jgi:cell pole-organizing protein PopZ
MTQSAKAQEPSMEEILASIRRIIADDDQSKPPPKPAPAAAPPPRPVAAAVAAAPPLPPRPLPAAPPPTMNQSEVDAMMAGLDAPPGGEPAPQEPEDVLDLTESMAAQPPPRPAPHFQTIDGQPDVIFAEASAPEPAPRIPEEPRRHPAPAAPSTERPLLSQNTTAAVDSAFNTLAQTVLVQNARTLEDLVREMLRPMLKAWLDDNLPSMVERMVRAEIERVSRSR